MAPNGANAASSPSTPRPAKTMSSNLMTMKFMQRAAASQSQKQPTTPDSPGEPPSKRRKTDTRTPDYGRAEALASSLRGKTTPPPLSDLQRMEAATAEEEGKRARVLERLAAEAGETKWVLSTAQEYDDSEGGEGGGGGAMKVSSAGYGDIDEEGGGMVVNSRGRRSFGRLNDEVKNGETRTGSRSSQASPHSESGSSDEAGSRNGEVADDTAGYDPANTQDLFQAVKGEMAQRAKAEKRAKRDAKQREVVQVAEKRRSKEVNLNRLSAISGGGGLGGVGNGRDVSNMECFRCGEKGHAKKDCPETLRKRDRGTDSRKGKSSEGSLDYRERG